MDRKYFTILLLFICFTFILFMNYEQIFGKDFSQFNLASGCVCATAESQQCTISDESNDKDTNDILPDFAWYREMMIKNISRKNFLTPNIAMLTAFEFPNQIAIHILSLHMFGRKIYCHYYDINRMPLGEPFETFVFPESVIFCARRRRAFYVAITEKKEQRPEFSIPLIKRLGKPRHFFTVCLAPIYGSEPKWLQIIEFVEHHKLQGATYFYAYVTDDLSSYDRKILDYYVMIGEMDVIVMQDQWGRPGEHWHTMETHECLHRSRNHANWTAFIDLDERLFASDNTSVSNYLRTVTDPKIASVTFRQKWILKDEQMPAKYVNLSETEKWLPTMRFHNTSGVTPPGWVVKTIIDPSKVFIMWIHYPMRYYSGYRGQNVHPSVGLSRHYRNKNNWVMREVVKFGPLTNTDYPKHLSTLLINAVISKVKYVYGGNYSLESNAWRYN